jgi:membrane protease subunit (stomatin/prohibitin family)
MAAAHLVGAQADAMRAAAANEGAGAAMAFMGMNMAATAGGANAQALYKMGQTGWTCRCGAVNQGKFCQECGARKPSGAPLYRCDKCGWQPEDPANPPKFCPECGDRFDDNDRQ